MLPEGKDDPANRRDEAPADSAPAERVTLQHIGIAVDAVEQAARAFGALLGLELKEIVDVPTEAVRAGFLEIPGGGALELLQPTDPDSTIGRFLAGGGPGIHHLSFRVASCQDVIRRARAAGIRPLEPAPRPGAGGSMVAFFHPKDTAGVLIEVVER